MSLKRDKITSKQFGKAFNGYDKIEVQAFQEWIADEYDVLRTTNVKLQNKIDEYEKDYQKYEKEKADFKQEQIQAKKEIDGLKREASKEYEIAKIDSKANAQKILRGAYTQTKDLKDDIDKLKKIKQSFIKRYQTILRDQLDTLKVFQIESLPGEDSSKIISKPTSKKH